MIETSIEAAGLKLAAFSSAPIETFNIHKPVTLGLHGWLDNAESLKPLAIASEREQFIVLDLPGHGHSQHRPPGAYYYFSEWAMDIAALIEAQGWQQVHLVGHSMGGFIAELTAIVIPQKIKSVFLIEAFGLLTYDEQETSERLREAFASRMALQEKSAPLYENPERLVQARSLHGGIAGDLIRPVVMRNLQQVSSGWQWRIDPRLRLGSPFRYSLAQVDQLMRSLQCRLILIRGSEGYKNLDAAVTRWGAELETHWIDGGHHVHLEHVDTVVQHLNAFLSRPN